MRPAFALAMAVLLAGCTLDPGTPHIEPEELLLLGTPESPIEVSVMAIQGREPPASVLAEVKRVLESLNSPGSVRISPTSLLPGTGDPERHWDLLEMLDLDDALAPPRLSRSLRIYYLDGVYESATGPRFGTSVEAAAFVFPDWMDDNAVLGNRFDDPTIDPEPRILATTMHEVGHSLGLVGVEAPMLVARHPPKSVDPCQCHSDRPDSVMSYPTHDLQRDLAAFVAGEPDFPTTFDSHDWDDLRSHQKTLRKKFGVS